MAGASASAGVRHLHRPPPAALLQPQLLHRYHISAHRRAKRGFLTHLIGSRIGIMAHRDDERACSVPRKPRIARIRATGRALSRSHALSTSLMPEHTTRSRSLPASTSRRTATETTDSWEPQPPPPPIATTDRSQGAQGFSHTRKVGGACSCEQQRRRRPAGLTHGKQSRHGQQDQTGADSDKERPEKGRRKEKRGRREAGERPERGRREAGPDGRKSTAGTSGAKNRIRKPCMHGRPTGKNEKIAGRNIICA